MKKLITVVLVVLSLIICIQPFAAEANAFTSQEEDEINRYSGGLYKKINTLTRKDCIDRGYISKSDLKGWRAGAFDCYLKTIAPHAKGKAYKDLCEIFIDTAKKLDEAYNKYSDNYSLFFRIFNIGNCIDKIKANAISFVEDKYLDEIKSVYYKRLGTLCEYAFEKALESFNK